NHTGGRRVRQAAESCGAEAAELRGARREDRPYHRRWKARRWTRLRHVRLQRAWRSGRDRVGAALPRWRGPDVQELLVRQLYLSRVERERVWAAAAAGVAADDRRPGPLPRLVRLGGGKVQGSEFCRRPILLHRESV